MMWNLRRNIHKSVAADSVVEVSESLGIRSLHLGSDTIQSSMRVRDPNYLELNYTRAMMCMLLFAPKARHVMTLGLGGGSVTKYVYANCENIRQTVLEINPQVISIARSHFFVPQDDARLQILCEDGMAYVRQHRKHCDILVMDAFGPDGLDESFATLDFFESCRLALNPDGLFMMNLWGSDKNFDIYLRRIEEVFDGQVLILPTGRPGNVIVFAPTAEMPNPTQLRQRAQAARKQHGTIEFQDFAETLLDRNSQHFFNVS